MMKSSILAIAIGLLLATTGVALAQGDAGTGTSTDADCNRVFKAKAAADKNISSNQLARDLNLPIEKVNTCLLRLRQGPRVTPQGGQ